MSEDLPDTEFVAEPTLSQSHAKGHGVLNFALDFGPLLVFFLTYKLAGKGAGAAIQATIAFMAAIVLAMIVGKWKLGKVTPMQWLSAVLVLGFGALTIYFHDQRFIQMKPTIIYLFFAALLIGGWLRGKALLKYVFEAAFEGLNDKGWLLISRNWGLFFAAMAVLNEVLRVKLSFDDWLTFKVWGMTALSFGFTLANVPMLLKHGLGSKQS